MWALGGGTGWGPLGPYMGVSSLPRRGGLGLGGGGWAGTQLLAWLSTCSQSPPIPWPVTPTQGHTKPAVGPRGPAPASPLPQAGGDTAPGLRVIFQQT